MELTIHDVKSIEAEPIEHADIGYGPYQVRTVVVTDERRARHLSSCYSATRMARSACGRWCDADLHIWPDDGQTRPQRAAIPPAPKSGCASWGTSFSTPAICRKRSAIGTP